MTRWQAAAGPTLLSLTPISDFREFFLLPLAQFLVEVMRVVETDFSDEPAASH